MKAALVILVGLLLSGCTSTFTSITPAGENNYYVTRTKNGFFKVSGTLYQCQGQGKKMICSEVNSQ